MERLEVTGFDPAKVRAHGRERRPVLTPNQVTVNPKVLRFNQMLTILN
jgi:hypothetical protein